MPDHAGSHRGYGEKEINVKGKKLLQKCDEACATLAITCVRCSASLELMD